MIPAEETLQVNSRPRWVQGKVEKRVKGKSVILAALKECSKKRDLEAGKALHSEAVEAGCDAHVYVATALVTMYSKCGSMQDAKAAFDKIPRKDAPLWNSLLLGYVENGESVLAMELFTSMDCEPSSVTFLAALKACADSAKLLDTELCLENGMEFHRRAGELGFDTDLFVANTLVHMYSNCKNMLRAQAVFDKMPQRDSVSWNNLILGYVENGEGLVALEIFTRMDREPDRVTFIAVLKACADLAKQSDRQIWLEKGMSIHRQARERGLDTDLYVMNTLIDMYVKCGSMLHARECFNTMTRRDIVSWNILLLGYVENGESDAALELFRRMDCQKNCNTFVTVLKACINLATQKPSDRESILKLGMVIHEQSKEHGFDTELILVNTLVDMYSSCGGTDHARALFENWNSSIMGCERNSAAIVSALKACTNLATQMQAEKHIYLKTGMAIHRQATEAGTFVLNALIDMYSKCGSMTHAQSVFDSMSYRDVFSWTSLVLGYVENGEGFLAMDLFMKMECEPDSITFMAALKACGSSGIVSAGRNIHLQICKLGMEVDQVVANSLVDLYVKCGNMAMAERVFDGMTFWNVVSWNTLLTGYNSVGDSTRVLSMVENMQETGLQMDDVTFVLVLTSCSQAGMVEEGKQYFKCIPKYGITLNVEHYHCMIDMLGRANRLQEALDMIVSMPFNDKSVAWTTLLGACRSTSNLEIGKVAFDSLVACNVHDAAPAYVLMRDIYTKLGILQEIDGLNESLKCELNTVTH